MLFDTGVEHEGACLAVASLCRQALIDGCNTGELGMVSIAVLLCCHLLSLTHSEGASKHSVQSAFRS